MTHHSIPPPPYIPPKRTVPETSTADYMGAYNKFIEQNVKKSVEAAPASCEVNKSLDEHLKKNIENFLKTSSYVNVAKKEKQYSNLTRIQNGTLSKNERTNVNISNLSTIPLCSNIKSIRPIFNNSTQNQSPLMLSSSIKALAAPISLLATNSESPSTPPTLLNCTSRNMAKGMTKKTYVTPINYNEQLLSNLVKREMISTYSTPSTTCSTGTSFNNIQLLYPHPRFEQIYQNAINPPQTQTQSTIQQHGQSQRSKEIKPQPQELHKKHNSEQLQKVLGQQKYIINTGKRSTEPCPANYSRNKIKVEQSQSSAYKISSSQDKTLLSEPSAPISGVNTSISQAFIYNQVLNLKNNLLQGRLLGVSSEDN